jgi:anthranilate synthase component I
MPGNVAITEYIADGITPVGAFASMTARCGSPSFLLESAPAPERSARFSIIGLGALAELRATDGRVAVTTANGCRTCESADVLTAARELLRRFAPDPRRAGVWGRFLGAYGAAAFEFAGYFERLPSLARGGDPMPDWHLVIPRTLVVFDHLRHRAATVSLPDEDGVARHDPQVASALRASALAPLTVGPSRGRDSIDRLEPDPRFPTIVDAARCAIGAGEVFQVVLAQRWSLPLTRRAFDAYRALRSINPSPYMFYLDLGWGALFGSSPETLVRLDGTTATLRPLAGTARRPDDALRERRVAARLLRDPKERAEHVMLVDLGRNDLGRVCEPGSVRVDELLSVERFSHVLHLASQVSGRLRPDCDAFDLFAAAFPAGTVSGAPKIRAMELIASLEGGRRGFYGGAVGYFGFDGSMDACITLRSAHAVGDRIQLAAGAGIVADSRPDAEDRECRAKAAAVADAIWLPRASAS